MSQITENTIVVKAELEQQLLADAEKYADTYHRVSGFNRVYGDDKIVVYVFDANGDGPWEVESDTVEYLALETDYLDGDEPWTRINGEDSDMTIAEWLKDQIPEEEYEKVVKAISYSA